MTSLGEQPASSATMAVTADARASGEEPMSRSRRMRASSAARLSSSTCDAPANTTGASPRQGAIRVNIASPFFTLPFAGALAEPIRDHADCAADQSALIAGAVKTRVKPADGARLLNVERLSRRCIGDGIHEPYAANVVTRRECVCGRTANVARADDRYRCHLAKSSGTGPRLARWGASARVL